MMSELADASGKSDPEVQPGLAQRIKMRLCRTVECIASLVCIGLFSH